MKLKKKHVANPLVLGEVMGSNLGQSRGITKDIKSQLGDSNCKSRRNALAKTGTNHYHADFNSYVMHSTG